jgi:hypothetical protein
MHVFHIKGFSGLVLLVLGVLAALAVFLLLPASFMMVLWNAVIFEGLKGPEVDLYQGFLMWGMVLMLIKILFNPEFNLQFQHASAFKGHEDAKKAFRQPEKAEEQQAPAAIEETTAEPKN